MTCHCCEVAPAPCCAPAPVKSSWPLSKKLELVCAIAISAFAAYHQFALFSLSAAAGCAYQVVKVALEVKQDGLSAQRPGCGQGFGEPISQMSLLSPEVVLATAYVAWRHLMHDPRGFIPFVGFFVGMGIAHHSINYYSKGSL